MFKRNLLSYLVQWKQKEERNSLILRGAIHVGKISPAALSMLHYFYEEPPDIEVIAAGLLFEVYLEKYKLSFPFERVEFTYLYPPSF